MTPRSALSLAACLVVVALAGGARAEGPEVERRAAASRLYAQGEEAHGSGRYAEAARAFAEADELMPNEAALQAALVAVLETDEAVLGMTLVARASRAPFHDPLQEAADRARARFEGGVGRVVVQCAGCEATIDGRAMTPGIASYASVGRHEVVLSVDGRPDRRAVDVEPRAIVTLVPVAGPGANPTANTGANVEAPPVAPTDPPADRPATTEPGPSPVWFWAGLGVTAALGAGAIASGVDTMNRRDDFEQTPTQETADAGSAAQLRTNVLVGVTAGVGLVTAALGLFVVDWSDDGATTAARLELGPAGASATLRF